MKNTSVSVYLATRMASLVSFHAQNHKTNKQQTTATTTKQKGGYCIAAPTIVAYGTDEMKKNLLPALLLGKKRICLAISEPFAGITLLFSSALPPLLSSHRPSLHRPCFLSLLLSLLLGQKEMSG